MHSQEQRACRDRGPGTPEVALAANGETTVSGRHAGFTTEGPRDRRRRRTQREIHVVTPRSPQEHGFRQGPYVTTPRSRTSKEGTRPAGPYPRLLGDPGGTGP